MVADFVALRVNGEEGLGVEPTCPGGNVYLVVGGSQARSEGTDGGSTDSCQVDKSSQRPPTHLAGAVSLAGCP